MGAANCLAGQLPHRSLLQLIDVHQEPSRPMSSLVAPLATRLLGAPLPSLIWTLIRTDFKSRYHGSAGGFIWALLKPFTMFVVLMSVFSFLFATDPTYRLNLIIGLFLYDFFGESTKAGLSSLHAKGYLLAKAKFPSAAVVISSISNSVVTLGVFVAVMFLWVSIDAGGAPVAGVGLFLVYLLLYAGIVIGLRTMSSIKVASPRTVPTASLIPARVHGRFSTMRSTRGISRRDGARWIGTRSSSCSAGIRSSSLGWSRRFKHSCGSDGRSRTFASSSPVSFRLRRIRQKCAAPSLRRGEGSPRGGGRADPA